MRNKIYKYARRVARRFGADIVPFVGGKDHYPLPDMDDISAEIIATVENYTMTTPERIFSVIDAVRYITKYGIEGAFVECGVWRGGSAMAMALTLNTLDIDTRDIYLYDTFSGMPEPSEEDISLGGSPANIVFQSKKISANSSDWCFSEIDEVRKNLNRTGYPEEKFHLISGKVEDTLPVNAPERIALLRLDTDWYESTKHELVHLFPLLTKHGVLIVDDYGHWKGARKAVDEYISENRLCLFLSRVDYTARVAIKG